MFDKLNEILQLLVGDLWRCVLPAAIAVIVLWIAWRLFRRRRRLAAIPPEPDLKIDILSLGDQGPPKDFPALELFNLPMRLAAIVLAPVGRSRELPTDAVIPEVIDAIVPGLDKVAALHRPLIRRWPSQVSASGFAHLFFNNVRLPGTGGKGTPWSSVAGMFKLKGQPVMAGLVLRAASTNSLGQTVIEEEHQWLGCLRVKWG